MQYKFMFPVPNTRLIKVIYQRNGVKYHSIIPRPINFDSLATTMLMKYRVKYAELVGATPVSEIRAN